MVAVVRRAVRLLGARMVSSSELTMVEKAKREAARACAERHIKSGSRIGVGSGSTVRHLVDYLETVYKTGEMTNIVCVPTSYQTKRWLIESGLPVADLDSVSSLDVCIDGADEVDDNMDLIKGGGGCLTREKIVQHASAKFYVIADYTKESARLGDKYTHLPIEVVPYAAAPLLLQIPKTLGGVATLRQGARKCGPVITDNGGYLIDWTFPKGVDTDWKRVQAKLADTPGIIETGLFIGVTDEVFFAQPDGNIKHWIRGQKKP